MKKTTFKEKVKSIFNFSFDKSQSVSEQDLVIANENRIGKIENEETTFNESKPILNILRQVLFFLPGAFLLFMVSTGWTYFGLMGASILAPMSLILGFILLISGLMVIFGIGDIRKAKHIFLPISIMSVGFLAGLFAYFFTGLGQFGGAETLSMFFIPFAFMMPFLTKFIIDSNETKT